MSTPTIIFIKHGRVGSRDFGFGDELPPGLLPRETIDKWLDEKWLAEAAERRSIYKLLHVFSGCSEREELSSAERNNLCLDSTAKS